MLSVRGICKRFGGHRILENVSFAINPGECAGLVGPTGSGKTTLLRIIAGAERPDTGSIDAGRGLRLGYLRQGYHDALSCPVRTVFPTVYAGDAVEEDLANLARRLADSRDARQAEELSRAYEAALSRVETAPSEATLRSLRVGLGLRSIAPDEPVGRLSGGERTKLGLFELVASRPDILLLDEPTNNLDIGGLGWLDTYLASFRGPVLLVSHDRTLLDDHADVILELDPAPGRIAAFPGNYSAYRDEKVRRNTDQWTQYGRQQRRERQVEQAITALQARAQRTENRSINFYFRKRAAKIARRAVTLERRLRRELEQEGRVEKPVRLPYRVRAAIEEGERAGDTLILASDLTLAVAGRALLHEATFRLGWGERIALVGPNGAGKTTLLRAILGQVQPAGGSLRISPGARVGYLPQSEESADFAPTCPGRTPLDVIRAERPLSEAEARRFLHRFLFAGDDPLTPLDRLSYGQRRRLDLARLVVTGANLLLLDEPTNHLDIPSREAFEAALADFSGAMLVVTHDRYLIESLDAGGLAIEDGRLASAEW